MARRQSLPHANAETSPDWSYKADVVTACNCDWGCPCNFDAPPTYGFCEGGWGFKITEGRCGDVGLETLSFAVMAAWPKAIHYGGGTAKIWIDEKAQSAQRAALEKILKGEYGGKPWPIFAKTYNTWLETTFVPFEWRDNGPRSRFKAGDEVKVELEPFRNPVTGEVSSAKIILPDALVCHELNVTSTTVFSVFTDGLKYATPGRNAWYGRAEHSNRSR